MASGNTADHLPGPVRSIHCYSLFRCWVTGRYRVLVTVYPQPVWPKGCITVRGLVRERV